MSIQFALTASQQAALLQLLADQQTPGNAQYHRWLTPEQYAGQYGLAQSDIDAVATWLKQAGLSDVEPSRSRTSIAFSGTAGQVGAAFGTSIHRYTLNGATHIANASDPVLPKALEGIAAGIRGLHDFHPKPQLVRAAASQAHFTSSISGNHFLAPDDFAAIYDIKALYNSGIDGTGQRIAVAGQTDISLSDIEAFRSAAGLSTNNPQIVLTGRDPGTSSDDEVEADLDVEWSGAVARSATIIYVNSTDAFTSAAYAINNDLAPVLSISYGACEADAGSAEINTLTNLFEQANAEGITVVAASGDQGAADCDDSTASEATRGLAVDIPASIPYVTGVGGTTFDEGSSSYWSSSNNSLNGSALSYIPEVAWNDTAADNELSASGGGASAVFSKPSWQTGTGVPSDGSRDVPDVSFAASPDHDGYLICSQGSCVTGFRNTDSTLNVVGGTSCGAPTFAAIVALLNQKTTESQGNVNPTLYGLAATSASVFHDITTGTNQVPCRQGSTDCPASGELGYSAGTGYDQVTGLGSIDAYNLVAAWTQLSVSIAEIPDGAADVSIGPDGNVWAISKDGATYTFDAETDSWIKISGAFSQVVAGPSGVVWALDSSGNIYRWNASTQSWVSVTGNLSQIAVGADGDVWGLNSGGDIYHFDAAASTWENIPGALAQISVGFDGAVWGINSVDEIYRLNPGGNTFEWVPGYLKHISVGADGDTWGLNSTGSIYHFNRVTQGWDQVAGTLAQISVGSGSNVWGVNTAGNVYKFDATNSDWTAVSGNLTAVSASADGAAWGIDSSGATYRLSESTVTADTWHQIPGALTQVAVSSDGAMWGINAQGQIYTFDALTQGWTNTPGQLSQIAIAANGIEWGINAAGRVYEFDTASKTWIQVPGTLSKIAVSDTGDVWGINSASSVYRYNASSQSWSLISGSLSQIAVGADGSVWGIDSQSHVYRFNTETQAFVLMPGSLSKIAVGSAGNVWGLDADGAIYRFNAETQSWTSVPGALSQISVAFDGAVWGINADNLIWRFDATAGTWTEIGGALSTVAAGADASIWGINSGGQVYRYQWR